MRASNNTSMGLTDTRNHLSRIDRKDWFRWATTMIVCLLLTAGVFSLAVPTLRRDWTDQDRLNVGVMGLLGMVLLFVVYTAYQQVLITRLRHQHTAQIGMDATLEVLKPGPATMQTDTYRQREYTRFHVDMLVKIEARVRGKMTTVFGRTSDLSEGGMGIVIPESIEAGEPLMSYLPIGKEGQNVALRAVVRHQRGFYHGCEFLDLSEQERQALRAGCAGAVPVFAHRPDTGDSANDAPVYSRLG